MKATVLTFSAMVTASVGALLGAGCGGGSDSDFVITRGASGGSTTGSAGSAASSGSAGGDGSTSGSATGGTGTGGGGDGGAGATSGAGGAGGGCAEVAWFCDEDKDAHGDHNAVVKACDAPPGGDATCAGPYTASSDDCAPVEPNAYPGEMKFFGTAAKAPVYGAAFDYDCNGKEERDTAQLFKGGGDFACGFNECFGINIPAGFKSDAACGSKDGYYKCAQKMFGPCEPTLTPAAEPLRCR